MRTRPSPAAAALAGAIVTLAILAAAGTAQPAPARANLQLWEYATFHDSSGGMRWISQGARRFTGQDEVSQSLGLGHRRDRIDRAEILDALGAAGWELVDTIREHDGDGLEFRFKRPL